MQLQEFIKYNESTLKNEKIKKVMLLNLKLIEIKFSLFSKDP